MKTSKSPENNEVTPSKKKLKQARLPFKLITETPVTPVTPQARKRKLSAAEAESTPKIGKICKENDLVDDIVTISDDESSNKTDTVIAEKPLNPFVKLVDTAWKKKIQKSKKKKSDKKKASLPQSPAVEIEVKQNDCKDEVESMDVDLPPESDSSTISNGTSESKTKEVKESSPNPKQSKHTRRSIRTSKASKKKPKPVNDSKCEEQNVSELIVLEDSYKSEDVNEITAKITPDVDVSITDDTKTASSTEVVDEKDLEITEIQDTVIKSKVNVEDEAKTTDGTKDKEAMSSDQYQSLSDKSDEINPVTPKRSTRNKTNSNEKASSKSNGKPDDSISSNPATPKHNRSLSVTTSLDDSMNDSTLSASNLTPKQLQKKLEAVKKREEREKEKQEREKKKLQEKEERAKQKQEKEEQKKKEREEKEEARRKEKEEKEEQKRKEKEEKERQKELEKKQKEEKEEQKKKEREEKEEQRKKEKEAREEEKRKKQEALELEKQEQELKKKKAAEAFVNFFVPKQKSEKDQPSTGPVSKNSVLSSFTIKNDMRLAPTVRVDLTEEKKQKLDEFIQEQKAAEAELYIKSLRNGCAKPLSSGKTWPLSEKDDDVMIIEDELPPIDDGGEIITCDPAVREKMRPKLLSFHDNRRPPYWGTWRKKSSSIKPKKPFGQDGKHLDYEVDSDEEWEEDQEGESIDGSAAGSDDEQDADEYEVDNEVFVPHGYLSDEEATMDDDDVLSLSPETQKARLKHLEDEFESEMKKPTEKLKPRLYGILWEPEDGGKPAQCVDALWNYFKKLSMVMNDPTSLLQPSNEPEESEKKKVKKKKVVSEGEKQSSKSDKKKKSKAENKDTKPKSEPKNNTPEVKKNQPGINSFLTKKNSI